MRGTGRPRVMAMTTASGRNVTMFVARSFGLPIIPEIDPWSRSPFMRLFPWRKSTTPRRATYPIAKRISHDSHFTALTPLTQLIISTKTITTFE